MAEIIPCELCGRGKECITNYFTLGFVDKSLKEICAVRMNQISSLTRISIVCNRNTNIKHLGNEIFVLVC